MTEALLLEGLEYAEQNFLDENADHLKVDKQLVRGLLDLTGKKVLDFGCGMGGMTLWYGSNWDCSVYGLDIDGHHIEVANTIKNKHRIDNVHFIRADLLKTELEGNYDYVFLNDVVEHIPMDILEAIFKKISTLLSPNCRIFISYPPWKSPYASHLNHVIKIPWCQFLPQRILNALIEKHNHPIVGEIESDLKAAYAGLNRLTPKKITALIKNTGLKKVYRKSHCVLNKIPGLKNIPFRFFPFNYLITKEFLLLEKWN